MSELVSHPSKAADYRRRAEEIRTFAAQISLMDDRYRLLATARHLEALAVDEQRQEAASEPHDTKPTNLA